MNTEAKLPFYAKLAFILVTLSVITCILYLGHQVFIPVFLALLFAILLRPVVNFLNRKLRFPHVIAAILAVVLFILVIAGIIFFVSWQIGDMASDWDKIQANLAAHYHNLQQWVQKSFHISYNEQDKYIKQATQGSLNGASMLSKGTINSFTNTLLTLILIPFLMFLFLLYRNLLLKFLTKLVSLRHEKTLQEILFNVKMAIQSFLVGLLIEMGVVASLTSLGYMIAGIQYPVLLGVITGILNLIPYIGILVAGLLSIISTLTGSADLSVIVSVIVVNVTVQLIDNNILVPMIVSSKVKINALVSIIGIIIGGQIAGVAGMFLAIPMIAILKVIFDRIESLEAWGFLMGDDLPKTYEWGKLKLPSFHAGNSGDPVAAEDKRSDIKESKPSED